MDTVYRALAAAFASTARHFLLSIGATITSLVLSLPIVAILGAVAAGEHSLPVLTVGFPLVAALLPNPALAGLHALAHDWARDEPLVTYGDLWTGLRRFIWMAAGVWIISLAGTGVILANILFYASHDLPVSLPMQAVWGAIFLCWLGIHLFVYPLVVVQERKKIGLIYRNAAIMGLSRPLFTFSMLAAWLLVLSAMTLTGLLVFFGLALGANVQHHAAKVLLDAFEARDRSGTGAGQAS